MVIELGQTGSKLPYFEQYCIYMQMLNILKLYHAIRVCRLDFAINYPGICFSPEQNIYRKQK